MSLNMLSVLLNKYGALNKAEWEVNTMRKNNTLVACKHRERLLDNIPKELAADRDS